MTGNVIPKDELASYQAWRVGSFDSKPQRRSGPVIPQPPIVESSESEQVTLNSLPTADDIARLHEETRAEAYRIGYEEGRQAGEESFAAGTREEIAKLSVLVGNFQSALAQMDQTIADQLLDLAIEIAAQVLRGSVDVRRDVMLPVVREAIAALPIHHAHIMLHLNPGDAVSVREQIGEQLSQTGTQIIEDNSVSPGGCMLKAGSSEVDASMETRWKRVLEALGVPPREWLKTL